MTSSADDADSAHDSLVAADAVACAASIAAIALGAPAEAFVMDVEDMAL